MRRPLSLTSWAILGLVVLALAYTGILVILALSFPSDGASLHLSSKGLVVGAVRADNPLQVGDIIVSVNRRPIDQGLQAPGAWRRFLLDTSSAGAVYGVMRDGQYLDLAIPWYPMTPLQLLTGLGFLSATGIVMILSAALIVLSRTRDPAAPVVALAFCFEGVNLVNNAWMVAGTGLAASTFWFYHPLDLLSFGLTFSAALHAMLVFPEPVALVRRFPRGPYVVHALNLLLAMAGSLVVGTSRMSTVRATAYSVFYPLAAFELVGAMGVLAYTYLHSHRPGVRNQIRWLLWGVVIGPLPWLLLDNLPGVLGRPPIVPLEITGLALIVIPVSFFFSVTRRGLMTVDVLIQRSMVFVTLVGMLSALYLLGMTLVEWLAQVILGGVNTRLVSFALLVLIALVASPLQRGLHELTERVFYRYWVHMEKLLDEIGGRLSTTLQLQTLGSLLTGEFPERMQVTQAALLLCRADGSLGPLRGDEPCFPADHPLVAEIQAHDTPLAAGESRYREGVLGELGAGGWELGLPLRSGGRLVGLYLLGPRKSGDLYSRQEVERLRGFCRQVAATLENARLYSEIERYTAGLQELVADRTGELAEANLQLASERDRLNVVLQNMADGLLVTDTAGGILLLNPPLEEMVRRPAGILLGQPAGTATGLPALTTLLAQAVERPGQVLAEDMAVEGGILRASASALRDGSAVITVLRDVTHEREVDRMKTEFVSTVSHELRTPLTSVLGFAKLIGRTVEKDLVPAVPAGDARGQRALRRLKENLDIIVSEGERLTRLINDVLDIAKMEAGKVEWHDQPFALDGVIAQAVENVRSLAVGKALPLNFWLPNDLPPLLADPDRVLQVMTNLLSNAIKFTDHGEVTVEARTLQPGEEADGWRAPEDGLGGVLIAVRDTGVGIPPEALPRLFQRFQQVGDTLRERPRGTGLGLAICREIVSHYGGTIWAKSEPGSGSTFSFTLPLVHSVAERLAIRQQPAPEEVEPAARAHPATVLVADDDGAIRELLRQTLGDAGYIVLEAADGAEAISRARQQQPDLLILDLKMPVLTGLDVTQVLKADGTTAHIPIVFLSAEDPRRSLSLGAAAQLTKPIEIEALLHTVAQLLASARTRAGAGLLNGTGGQ